MDSARSSSDIRKQFQSVAALMEDMEDFPCPSMCARDTCERDTHAVCGGGNNDRPHVCGGFQSSISSMNSVRHGNLKNFPMEDEPKAIFHILQILHGAHQ